MLDYMYFPENKLEYIPSIIMIVLVIIAAVLAIVIFKRISNRQLADAKKLEEQLERENIVNHNTTS